MSIMGIILSFSGFLYAVYVLIERLISDDYVAGNAVIVILILILSGFQILMLGVKKFEKVVQIDFRCGPETK